MFQHEFCYFQQSKYCFGREDAIIFQKQKQFYIPKEVFLLQFQKLYENSVDLRNFGFFCFLKNRRNFSDYITLYKSLMEAKETPIYSNSPPKVLGQLLNTCQLQKENEGDITVAIYEKCLVQFTSKTKTYVIFDFDLKFSFLPNLELQSKEQNITPTIIFQKGEQKITYFLKSMVELENWRQILKSKLNQRGFHEQFKPKKKIGKGNFASVYLAEKLEEKRNFAVKAFSKQAAYCQEKGKQCLVKQIEVMRAIQHKNCMRLFEVYQSDNSLYIVVQLLQGGQLYDKIKAKYHFKPHQTRTVMKSILEGLKQMHSKHIMHRDLKPQNIIFKSQKSFECSIADFGLAEFAHAEEYLFVRCGTPGYVAPEVINIKDMKTKYQPICDIFSLGLIFHVLLLGVSAFPGKTYNEVLAQNRASNITFEGEQYKKLEKVEPGALDLLIKMLKKYPLQRISAADALNHPYFSQDNKDEEERDIVVQLSRVHDTNVQSPLLLSSNPARKMEKITKKDSCVDFKMAKENLFTGKVETIAETNSTTNSMGKKFESILMPKISKFITKK